MEKPVLNNKDEFPDENVLQRYLGKTMTAWNAFMKFIQLEKPDYSIDWRYYNDGKSWLCKVSRKKKTVCWVSVFQEKFKTGFYFTEKAKDLIIASSLNDSCKDQFMNGERIGKLIAITVDIRLDEDLKMTKILMGIKEQLK